MTINFRRNVPEIIEITTAEETLLPRKTHISRFEEQEQFWNYFANPRAYARGG